MEKLILNDGTELENSHVLLKQEEDRFLLPTVGEVSALAENWQNCAAPMPATRFSCC